MTSGTRTWTRIVGLLTALAGIIMLVAGIVAWSTVSGELASQKIDVAAEGQSENIANSPFDALSQINLIKEHTESQMNDWGYEPGTTYAGVPRPDGAELAACRAQQSQGGADALSAECKTAIQNDTARTYLDNSNAKQASLYTSVLAFGVSFLVVGVGIVFLLIGSAGFMVSRKPQVVETRVSATERDSVTV